MVATRGGSGYPIFTFVSCEAVSEAPVFSLFQRLQTFDLKSSVVNFKTLLRYVNEEMSGAPIQSILQVVGLLELVKMVLERECKEN